MFGLNKSEHKRAIDTRVAPTKRTSRSFYSSSFRPAAKAPPTPATTS